jgi:uncharacterized protein YjbJ (UPF0337 family)
MGLLAMGRNKAQQLKGRIKQNSGRQTGNRRLQARGYADRIKGSVKQAGERYKRSFR